MASLLVILLLSPLVASLFFASVSAFVIVNLNCGSSTTIPGEIFPWTGDNLYIQNGESHVVSIPSSFSKAMGTLRAFTTRKKNCYSFNCDKGDRVLVRASFFYGNYDKKLYPPSFDMHFDGNYWVTVETSITDVVSHEVVYTVKRNTLSVCLAQTNTDQFPFISALEIRPLDTNVYGYAEPNRPLFLKKRIAFGANKIVRFPDDPYDRIWTPIEVYEGMKFVTSDADSIKILLADRPPMVVLKNAVMPLNFSFGLNFRIPQLPDVQVPIYMNTYFSEVTQLDNVKNKRSFQIVINNNLTITKPIAVPYESVSEMVIFNMSASSSTLFSFVPTTDSTLPALINAAELFSIGNKLTEGTNSNDVAVLAVLQDTFIVLQQWRGDPCLPSPYTWDWIDCSSDESPRITALYLSGFGLRGPLPDFSGMDALEKIDFKKNGFSGELPGFLGTFPKLRELNLADNNFSGTVPYSISGNKNIKLDLSGNTYLCTSGTSCVNNGTKSSTETSETSMDHPSSGNTTRKKKNVLGIILGTVLPIFFLV